MSFFYIQNPNGSVSKISTRDFEYGLTPESARSFSDIKETPTDPAPPWHKRGGQRVNTSFNRKSARSPGTQSS